MVLTVQSWLYQGAYGIRVIYFTPTKNRFFLWFLKHMRKTTDASMKHSANSEMNLYKIQAGKGRALKV